MRNTKELLKRLRDRMLASPLCPLYRRLYTAFTLAEYALRCPIWAVRRLLSGGTDPVWRQRVIDNVTFIYKSFERQPMAKRLYRSIQRYYPGVRVIIADDSRVPLAFDGPEILHLPFNSGLSRGIQAALDRVETPYVIRVDDDCLLTPLTGWERELRFLEEHPEADLSAVVPLPPWMMSARKKAADYERYTMKNAKPLLLPVGTPLDACHKVRAKVPNFFLTRTESLRTVGYDPNIRMIDHHEFFFRAAGVLVSTVNERAFVYHYHDPFDRHYLQYRRDWQGDAAYIRSKHKKA